MWPDRVSNLGPLALESDALRGLSFIFESEWMDSYFLYYNLVNTKTILDYGITAPTDIYEVN